MSSSSEAYTTIVISGPGMNALGTDLMNHILGQINAAGDKPLLFAGEGIAFSAGLDLKEVLRLDRDGMRAFFDLLEQLTARVYHHPAPTVAAVHGHAIAGGAVVARACDRVVVCSEGRGRVGLNEVALGLHFPPALLRTLMARIPPRHHTEVLLGAGLHKGPEAVRLGLADVLAEGGPETVLARAEQELIALSAHPAHAYTYTKKALQRGVPGVSEQEQAAFERDSLPVWVGQPLKNLIRKILKL